MEVRRRAETSASTGLARGSDYPSLSSHHIELLFFSHQSYFSVHLEGNHCLYREKGPFLAHLSLRLPDSRLPRTSLQVLCKCVWKLIFALTFLIALRASLSSAVPSLIRVERAFRNRTYSIVVSADFRAPNSSFLPNLVGMLRCRMLSSIFAAALTRNRTCMAAVLQVVTQRSMAKSPSTLRSVMPYVFCSKYRG